MGRIYDELAVFYSLVLGTAAIHQAYVEGPGDTASYARAVDRMTERVTAKLRVGAGERLLDIGCGAGQPALAVAKRTGCSVTGVNVSAGQIAMARIAAEAAGLADRTTFQVSDANHLEFPASSFDAALFFESISHLADRRKVLADAARCVRPGGVVVVAETVEVPGMGDDAWRARLQEIVPGSSLPTAKELEESFTAAGLAVEEIEDLTQFTRRDLYPRLLEEVTAARAEYAPVFGDEAFDQVLAKIQSVSDAFAGRTGYVLVTGRKL